MAFVKTSILTFFLLDLFVLKDGQAQLICYSCNSHLNGSFCHNPLDRRQNLITRCPTWDYVCTTTTYVTRRNFVTHRACEHSFDTCDRVYNSTLNIHTSTISNFRCTTCLRDLCNSGNHLSLFNPIILVFIISISLLSKVKYSKSLMY
ncbi:uncharacterized protein LOC126747540 [Anthonomus grandis grandis]|uniref:uncharacterized protein LOC126747540 n=1 Tax=Anthonomus grandis grandis TaxID=2921223 RepID=UPI0021650F01|nr:uncharacterized protein LOC126747540 [Anthonomus grandis grandis]